MPAAISTKSRWQDSKFCNNKQSVRAVHMAPEEHKGWSGILDKMLPQFLDSRSRVIQLQKHKASETVSKMHHGNIKKRTIPYDIHIRGTYSF